MDKINNLLNKLTTLPENFDINNVNDEDLDKLVHQINESYKLRILNSTDENSFFTNIKKEVLDKELTNYESNLKNKLRRNFLLEEKEIENKDLDKILEQVSSKLNQSADMKTQELILKLNSANEKIESYENNIIPSIKQQMEEQLNSNKIDFNLKNIISSHKNDLAVENFDLLYPGFKSILLSKYDIKIDNLSDTLNVKTKSGEYVYDNTRILNTKDIILKELKEQGILKKSNSNSDNSNLEKNILKGVDNIVNSKKSNNSFNSSAMEAAKRKLEELKK